ncbi:tetratricopeptide repeat protein [Bacillus sp. 2205SS5-2]|uniref:tetratricopeptide repeat protein n=1 Tax=Bacillus sp. 2205SS5-2 TaxID=3109031 RepID=UPI0030051E35
MRKGLRAQKERGKLVSFVPTGEYYFNKGVKAYHRQELQKSSKYLERAFQLEPLEPMIACQLAIVKTELGDYQQSNELLHVIVEELDPHMTECHYFLSNNYAHLGLFKEAYTHVTQYLEHDKIGEFNEDAEDLLDLLELDSDESLETLYEQDELISKQDEARKLLESGNFQKAIALLEEVIEEFPEFWSAYNNLALAHFYLGELEKAKEILEKVLEENPGNLHALCNLAVFHFYQQEQTKLTEIVKGLEKVRPIAFEHRFKLGATFALIGKFELAYQWLKNLQKQGYDTETGFYYWLAKAAYFTGHEESARNAWKKVLLESPEKEGEEPWIDQNETVEGFENHIPSLLKKLKSKHQEERIFGLFLLSVSDKQKQMLSHPNFTNISEFNLLEKLYLAEILQKEKSSAFEPDARICKLQETALYLYKYYQPVDPVSSGLYLLWFTIGINGLNGGESFTNARAFAAATEYIWLKLRSEATTQKEVSEKYGISPATLAKYTKIVNKYLI